MASEITKRWVKAAIALGEDPNVKILCPECQEGMLKVLDVKAEGTSVVERYLYCDKCGARNVMRMNRG